MCDIDINELKWLVPNGSSEKLIIVYWRHIVFTSRFIDQMNNELCDWLITYESAIAEFSNGCVNVSNISGKKTMIYLCKLLECDYFCILE